MSIVLKEKWKEVLDIFKASKNEELKDFFDNVENFLENNDCRKSYNGKGISMFTIENEISDRFGDLKVVKRILTFTKQKEIEGEPFDEIMFETRNKITNAIININKLMRMQTKGYMKVGTLMSCDDKKIRVFNFEIKGNKVTKFKEYKAEKCKEK